MKKLLNKLRISVARQPKAQGSGTAKPEVYSGVPGPSGALPPVAEVQLELPKQLHVLAGHTGPDRGVQEIRSLVPDFPIAFNVPTEWACGHSMSMYDASPISGVRSGNPIADCFCMVAYASGAVLALADGVNWGEPARRAARCAVLGSVHQVHTALGKLGAQQGEQPPPTTATVFGEMLEGVKAAQALILKQCGTLTTLVLCVVLPVAHSNNASREEEGGTHTGRTKGGGLCGGVGLPGRSSGATSTSSTSGASGGGGWVAMTLTVGDSAAWVWRAASAGGCVDELTAESHRGSVRDVRWTPGALGYALGEDPDLSNMTMSMTYVSEGDIVFLGSDGVADNFDPIILKIARAAPYASEVANARDPHELPPLDPDAASQQALDLMSATLRGIREAAASPPPPAAAGLHKPHTATSAAAIGAGGQGADSHAAAAAAAAGDGQGASQGGVRGIRICSETGGGSTLGDIAPAGVTPAPQQQQQQQPPAAAGPSSGEGGMLISAPGILGSFSMSLGGSGGGGTAAPSRLGRTTTADSSSQQSTATSTTGAGAGQSTGVSGLASSGEVGDILQPPPPGGPSPVVVEQEGSRQKGGGRHSGSGGGSSRGGGLRSIFRGTRGGGSHSPAAADAGPGPQPAGLTARLLVEGLLQHVYMVTEPHRLHVERRAAIAAGLAPPPYTGSGGGGGASGGGAAPPGSQQAPATRRQRDLSTDSPARNSTHAAFAKTPPGKLDHATVVAFQVGVHSAEMQS